MSVRPLDWAPVGLGSDPVPGDPDVVRQGGWDYHDTAQAINNAAVSLQAIEDGGQISLAVDAVMERKTDAMDAITQAYDRYQTTGDALISYATSLATAQQVADQALASAITAVHNKTSAAWSKTHYLNLAEAEDDQDTQRRYNNLVNDFQDDIDQADATIRQAQADIRQAQTNRDTAAEQAVSLIQEITDTDGLNDSWWDDWGAKLTSILDAISTIAGILALVVQFIPIIGQALGAVLLVVAAATAILSAVLKTVAAIQHHTSGWNALWSIVGAALACTGLGALKALSGLKGLKAATSAWKSAGGLAKFGGLKGLAAATGKNMLRRSKNVLNLMKPGWARNRFLGRVGEKASGITKNTRHIDALVSGAKYRIPDGLDDVFLSEVKNVRRLDMGHVGGQFEDFAAVAKRDGLDFVLYTRKTTKISTDMAQFLAVNNVTHVKLGTAKLLWEGAKDVRDLLFFK